MPLPPMRTARMTLRAPVEPDREEFVRVHAVSREHFAPWWPARDPSKTWHDEFTEQVDRAVRVEADGTGLRRIGVLDDGRIAGFFNLSQIFRGPFLNAFIGWSISADCLGQGLAAEGVTGMLDAAFAPEPTGLGLHRVQANIMPSNARSLRVAEKCGFRFEGFAAKYLKIAGRWEDHAMFAKVAEEHREAI